MFSLARVVAIFLGFCLPCGRAPGSTHTEPVQLDVGWRSPGGWDSPAGDEVRTEQKREGRDLAQIPPATAGASDTSSPPEAATSGENERARNGSDKRWHLDLALRSSHAEMSETKRLLDRRLEIPLRLDAFGVFSHPRTPIDRRTDLRMSSAYLGVGRTESDYLVWTLYGGGGWSEDRTHQRFAYAKLDVDFKYGLYYAGVAAEVYPWKTPPAETGPTWGQRLLASRPYLLAGFETGYVSCAGQGHYSVAGVRVYADGVTVRDWTFSWPIGVGWTMPLDDRWSFHLVSDYRFHMYRASEYNGWNFTSVLRRRF